MLISNVSRCPSCNGILKYYDSVKRILITKARNKRFINIKRFRCTNCHKIYRDLPDYIFKYKHYDADIIRGFRNGTLTSDILDYEDYPCELTIRRWLASR